MGGAWVGTSGCSARLTSLGPERRHSGCRELLLEPRRAVRHGRGWPPISVNILISESTAPFNDNTSNNGADVFTTDMEVYKYQIRPVDWLGWRYVAIPYSDFEVKSQGGDNVRTPADISAIRLQCQSCPSANANCPENADVDVRTDIDFVMFTEMLRRWINDRLSAVLLLLMLMVSVAICKTWRCTMSCSPRRTWAAFEYGEISWIRNGLGLD